MRLLLIFTVALTPLFAFLDTINTYSANFTQRITDDQNKSIVYRGDLKAKRPNMAVWHYHTPVEKQLYLSKHKAIIIEPELEQAIIRDVGSDIDFFTILSKAKQITNNTYLAHYREIIFIITMKKNVIERINYEDVFENNIELIFSKQQINKPINDTVFKALIPRDYDILRD